MSAAIDSQPCRQLIAARSGRSMASCTWAILFSPMTPWDRIGDIKAPTLLMGGEEDIITPTAPYAGDGERMPNADGAHLSKTLHGFLVENPASCARSRSLCQALTMALDHTVARD